MKTRVHLHEKAKTITASSQSHATLANHNCQFNPVSLAITTLVRPDLFLPTNDPVTLIRKSISMPYKPLWFTITKIFFK